MTNAKQVYEWVKTGHWNRRQFLEWAQPVPPRTWVGSGDLEDSNAYLTPPQRTERHELQAKGEHPAPCARHCEANAFQIVIKNLKAQLAQPEQEPVAVKHMKEWVEYLKRKSDFGQHMKIPSEMSAGACWELAIELEQFINTTPPQRKPLTHDELSDLWYKQSLDWMEFARAIEAAHGIKEIT